MLYSFLETIGNYVTNGSFIIVLALIIGFLVVCEAVIPLSRRSFKNQLIVVSISVTTVTVIRVVIEVIKKSEFSWERFTRLCWLDYINPTEIIIGLILFDADITVIILIVIAFIGQFGDIISNIAKEIVALFESDKDSDDDNYYDEDDDNEDNQE